MSTERLRKSGSFVRNKKKLFEKTEYTCQICGFSIKDQVNSLNNFEKPTSKKGLRAYYNIRSVILSQIQTHHITPLSEGGSPSRYDNMIVVCNLCHNSIHEIEDRKKLELEDTSNKVLLECFHCQAKFYRKKSNIKKDKSRFFCTRKCYRSFVNICKINEIILV